MKILLIEDDLSVRSFMRVLLGAQNYEILEASDGRQGITMALSHTCDLIILDLGLPDLDGLDVLNQIRALVYCAIIVVSARDKENDKIIALDSGADDYLTKPFSAQELLARIRVGLRHRPAINEDPQDRLKIQDLCVDFGKHLCTIKDEEIHLTPIEFDVLSLLIRNHGKVMTHHALVKSIWGLGSLESDIQTLRVTMANLRRKIELNPAQPQYILTEIGIGYRFIDS